MVSRWLPAAGGGGGVSTAVGTGSSRATDMDDISQPSGPDPAAGRIEVASLSLRTTRMHGVLLDGFLYQIRHPGWRRGEGVARQGWRRGGEGTTRERGGAMVEREW